MSSGRISQVVMKKKYGADFVRGVFLGVISTATAYSLWNYFENINLLKLRNNNDLTLINRAADILKHGVPDPGPTLHYYGNHVLAYNRERKGPVWVAEHLMQDKLKGTANRKHCYFKADAKIPDMFSASNEDFKGSGWSRGHMAPAGDNKHDEDSMSETFLLSNIVPQDFDNNSGFWNRLEMYCRDLTKRYDDVYVLSGPLFFPQVEQDGRKFVRYQVIGKNEVAVPTHLFKVIVAENTGESSKSVAAFIVPNQPITHSHNLPDFQVDVAMVESKLGVELLRNLVEAPRDLCEDGGCSLGDGKKFELFKITRDVGNARNRHQLEHAWKQLKEKGIKPDEEIKSVYHRKQLYLKSAGETTDLGDEAVEAAG